MSSIQIPNHTAFGGMTNRVVASLINNNTNMARLKEAIATASSGFEGTPGTQFEGMNNNFGITADPENPGKKGTEYSYAMDSLATAWNTFWETAQPYLAALDNGQMSM